MTVVAQSFGSGSSGNGFFIRSGSTALLIDCGLGPRILAGHLRAHGLGLPDLSAVLITHEHDDHVRGLASLRKMQASVHCSAGTARALGLSRLEHIVIDEGIAFQCGDASITAVSVSHDAADPMGYAIELAGYRICVVTDLGVPNARLAEAVAHADLIVFEANHDEHMLRSGPYPAYLKKRVASDSGHLSNRRAGEFLEEALRSDRRPRTIWLAHLSDTNNHPRLARDTVANAFGIDADLHDIVALPRRVPGPVWRPMPLVETEEDGSSITNED